MRNKNFLGALCLATGGALVLALLLVTGGTAGEYHTTTSLYCYDCHTMHNSMAHGWDGGTVGTSPPVGGTSGNWLAANGGAPNAKLLKANGVNALCLSCHDGRTSAPDVLTAHSNGYNREAGALNDAASGAPYESWKGHTLDSPASTLPPGYNSAVAGVDVWANLNAPLECTSCHSAHGGTAYRNLVPYGWHLASANSPAFKPTYAISATPPAAASVDVWINLASYTAGSGSVAGSSYYAQENISFGRNDTLANLPNGLSTSNRMSSFCAACHGMFHGGAADANTGAGNGIDFIRHPTAKTDITVASNGNYTKASTLSQVKTLVSTYRVGLVQAGDSAPSPFCLTCHKAHGNQNPFGLIFLNRTAASWTDEQGGTTGATGLPNLCHQCHSMGGG